MIKNSKLIATRITFDELPMEFFDNLNDYARVRSLGHLKNCLSLAADNRFITTLDNKPLLLVWAFRATLLSPHYEIGLVATIFLRACHVPQLKKMFWAWQKKQDKPIYACCDTVENARFLDFMKFTPTEKLDGKTKYEAVMS